MSKSLPDWVPEEIHSAASLESEKNLRIFARSLGDSLPLGRVPPGWTIQVDSLGARNAQHLTAESSGREVRWQLSSLGTFPIRIGPEVRRLELSSPKYYQGRRNARLAIEGGRHSLHFEGGAYQVNAAPREDGKNAEPPSFEAYVGTVASGTKLSISGNAGVRKLSGTGTVVIKAPMNRAKVDLDGDLEVDGRLDGTTVTVTGVLKAGSLNVRDASASSIEAGGDQGEDFPAISNARTLRAKRIEVSGTVAALNEIPTIIRVSEIVKVANAQHVVIQSDAFCAEMPESYDAVAQPVPDEDDVPNLEILGEVRDVQVQGVFGTCNLGNLTGPIDIGDARQIEARQIRGGPLRLIAREKLVAEDVSGSGILRSSRIEIKRDVSEEGGGLVLGAREALTVGGSLRRTVVYSPDDSEDTTIRIGHAGWREVKFVAPKVSQETLALTRISSRLGRSPTPCDPVEGCLIRTEGTVRILTDVSGSLITARRRLEVNGKLDATGLTGDDLEKWISVAESEPVHEDAWLSPVRAGECWVTGEVLLEMSQVVEFGSSFSCSGLSGGRVFSTTFGSIAVLGSITGAEVEAAKIGVAEEVAKSNVSSTEMVVSQGAIDSESLVVTHGDSEFKSAIEGRVRWFAAHGRTCHALSHIGCLEVLAALPAEKERDGEVEQSAKLLGEPEFKAGILILGESVKVLIELADRTDSTRRRSAHAEPVCDQLNLGNGAYAEVSSATVDFGEVLVDRCARLHHSGGTKGRLTIRLGKTSDADLLRVSASGTTRIEQRPDDQLSLFDFAERLPSVWIERGNCEVAATVEHLAMGDPTEIQGGPRPSHKRAPDLAVEESGEIRQLSGWFRLVKLQGRIQGAARQSRALEAEGAHKLPKPAKLMRCSLSEPEGGGRGGHLVAIDVSEMPFADVRSLIHVHWFEPDGRTLEKYAKLKLGEAERRNRAQKLRLLAEVSGATASSGASRSSVMWAAARAHNSVVQGRIEKVFRWIHARVGYGWKPGSAFVTLSVWILLLALTLRIVDPDPICAEPAAGFVKGPYGFAAQLARVISLPASLLRLDPGGAQTFAPVGCSAPWHLLAFAVTGFFLIYALLALRNYLKTPVER